VRQRRTEIEPGTPPDAPIIEPETRREGASKLLERKLQGKKEAMWGLP
jgi:hypothetical protein